MAGKEKPHGTDDETLMLIALRRERAWEAMNKLVTGFRSPVDYSTPTVTVLLEYLSNMVYCLELMLKLLSNSWSHHEVGTMYKTVFGADHPNEDFLRHLTIALRNQKYLFEPSADPNSPTSDVTIAHYIPEMEALFDQLLNVLSMKYRTFSLHPLVSLPLRVGEFIATYAGRFVSPTPWPKGMQMSPENMKEMDVRHQATIEATKAAIRKELSRAGSMEFTQGRASAIDGMK